MATLRSVDPAADGPIVLIGMMGSGKTTVGRALAARLGRPFVDLDEHVIAAEGASIAQLFDVVGSDGFRDAETRSLEEVIGQGGGPVIAAGGGVILRHRNRELLAQQTRVVWLDAPTDVLVTRVGSATDRPLLVAAPAKRLAALAAERRPLYREAADCRVDADQAVDDAVDAIVAGLAP